MSIWREREVTKFNWAWELETLGVLFSLISLAVIFYHYAFSQDSIRTVLQQYLPVTDPGSEFSLPAVVLLLISASVMILARKYRREHELDHQRVLFHQVALSIEHFQSGQYKQARSKLQDAISALEDAEISYLHPKRESNLKTYRDKLNSYPDEELGKVMKSTFPDVLQPICSEILSYDKSDTVAKTVSEMDTHGDSKLRIFKELLEDMIRSTSSEPTDIIKIGALSVVSLVIGVQFGTGWAVVPLTVFMIHQTMGGRAE